MLPKGKILVLRYIDKLKENCIQEHIEGLKKNKSCWYGKVGQKPSTKVVNAKP